MSVWNGERMSVWNDYTEKRMSVWNGYTEERMSVWNGYTEERMSEWKYWDEWMRMIKDKDEEKMSICVCERIWIRGLWVLMAGMKRLVWGERKVSVWKAWIERMCMWKDWDEAVCLCPSPRLESVRHHGGCRGFLQMFNAWIGGGGRGGGGRQPRFAHWCWRFILSCSQQNTCSYIHNKNELEEEG